MKRQLTSEYSIMMILLTVALLSFVPVHADQGQTGTVVFHLTGQAAPLDNSTGLSGSTTLDLMGNVQGDGSGGLIIQNLTGNLKVGSENYTITTGHGDSNKRGEFVIFGETGSGQLILHGSIQNNQTVTVDSPPSRLSSLAYLSLSGSMSLNSASDSLMSISVNVGQNSTISILENNTSVSANETSEATQFESTSSVTANIASLTEGGATNVIVNQSLTGINSTTVTELSNATVSNVLPGPTVLTVTATQLGNQTITVYVTQTVANSTLTTTSTAANATITLTTVTTVANTTVTMTNSTHSAP